ncbi:DUF2268 domain-containing protein [Kineosporia babensis]|uniref:DUF2268 domain-containing protein n=1 Tax=Kineosporia babensis TaxID=499548 RepID=A0A9X1NAQ7_9ACTN|nr:DUF2268 domain-containing putative Zn-dependent protease [Kineosporia babensis]MCD5309573.1 DUF2268 domain-containing protein [Kineosporia babensis]
MTITVLDTAPAIRRIVTAPPAARPDLLRAMVEPARGLYRYFPGEVDVVAMHGMSFGFPLDRDEDQILDALGRLEEAGAWARIEKALEDAVRLQSGSLAGVNVPDITVLFVLGDPGDAYFRHTVGGFSGNGSVTGYISLTLWPTAENLARLEATAVHELNHNLRYAPGGVVWDPATVAVGEQIVSEGLADAFARQMYGPELGYTAMGVPHLNDDEVFAKVLEGLGITGMQNFVSWVHGDAAAQRFGGTPVGLPTGAGYAVGNRLVDAYLAETGQNAAQALYAPSDTIIRTALRLLQ